MKQMRHFPIIFSLLLLLIPSLKAQKDNNIVNVIQKLDFQPNCISINSDNSKILIGGENEKAYILDLSNNKITTELNAHYQPVVNVYFSTISDGFYTVGDRSFKYWKNGAENPETIYTGSHTNFTDWTISKDEELFAGASYSKKFWVWHKGQVKDAVSIETTLTKNIISVALSPDKNTVAAGSLDSSIELWDINKQQRKVKILAHSGPVSCLSFINNGKYLISASHDGYAKLWNSETGDNLKNYVSEGQAINTIAISPDGKFFLAGTWDGFICLFAIATGDKVCQFNHHTSPVWDVCWNKDGKHFYSCDKNGEIVEWTISKQIYVDHFYSKQFEEEIKNNKTFSPRRNNESRENYKKREERAVEKRVEIVNKYYQMAMDSLVVN